MLPSSHQQHGPSEGHDDTFHSGWNSDRPCTTRLRETTWRSLCCGHHYLDLELKMVDRYEWRESPQQCLKHWIIKILYFSNDFISGLEASRKTDFSFSYCELISSPRNDTKGALFTMKSQNVGENSFSRNFKTWNDVTIIPSVLFLVSLFCFTFLVCQNTGKENRYRIFFCYPYQYIVEILSSK